MKTAQRVQALAVMLLLALALGAAWQPSNAQPSDCTAIYAAGGWVIEQCATDANVPTSMAVTLNGTDKGQATLVRIAHQAETGSGTPQVAVIYASGFVRLKQNADSNPPIPFGSSFVLGPAYWSDASTYFHNPQLQQLALDTAWLPDGPLRMRAAGTNGDFAITYAIELPPPRDRQTRLHVTQTFTATKPITIDATRRTEYQGLKLVQVSSMYVSPQVSCDGGRVECHDSNAIRFISTDGARRQTMFDDLTPSRFIVSTPAPLGSTWLDVLHTDDCQMAGQCPECADRPRRAPNRPDDHGAGPDQCDDQPR